MKYKVKIVPKNDPNAEGEWIEIEHEPFQTKSWIHAASVLEPFIPTDHFIAAIRT